jgi:hypothetical protein
VPESKFNAGIRELEGKKSTKIQPSEGVSLSSAKSHYFRP